MNTKQLKKIFIAVTLALPGSNFALAESASSIEAQATLANRYIFRGFNLSDSNAVIQGDVNYAHQSGFSVGLWGSQYDLLVDDGFEVDLLASYSAALTQDLGIEVGLTEYTYSGDTESTTEFYASLGLTSSLGDYALAFYRDVDLDTDYLNLAGEWAIMDSLSASLSLGQTEPDGGDSYQDYAAGVGYQIGVKQTLVLSYSYLDVDEVEAFQSKNNFLLSWSYQFQ